MDDANFTIPDGIREILVDSEYWQSLELCCPVFRTISLCLSYLESDSTPFSSIIATFIFLFKYLESDSLPANVMDKKEIIKNCLSNRLKSIYHPAMCLAFVLDPFMLHSFNVDSVGDLVIMDEIEKAGAILQADISSLLFEVHEFSTQFLSLDLNAKVSRYSIHPKLSWSVFYRRFLVTRQIALQLFSFPCTAAGGERNFKTRSRIHSKVRNRLVFDSVDMQLYVSYNCAQLKRNVLLEGKRNAKSFEEILIGHKIDEDLEEITWPEETEYLIVEDNQFTEN
jgi:hypothetical protein